MENKDNNIIIPKEKLSKTSVLVLIMVLVFLGIIIFFIYNLFFTTDNEKLPASITSTNIVINNNEIKITGEGVNKDENNLTFTKEGTYTISGTLNGCVTVDTDKDVIIMLNGANITCDVAPAISNINESSTLTLTLADNTINKLTDGGSSDYDGALFSNGPLIINGNGTLDVNGTTKEGISTKNSNITINGGTISITSKDDGINSGGTGGNIIINDCILYINAEGDGIDSNNNLIVNGGTILVMSSIKNDNGAMDSDSLYQINGGTVVALGNGMMESPNTTSSQKSILFNLTEQIEKNTLISLYNSDNIEIITFISEKPFKTITISSHDLVVGDYYLYRGGSHTSNPEYGIYKTGTYVKGNKVIINNMDSYSITGTNNWFGNIDNLEGNPNSVKQKK